MYLNQKLCKFRFTFKAAVRKVLSANENKKKCGKFPQFLGF